MIKMSNIYSNKLGELLIETPKFDLYSTDGDKYQAYAIVNIENNSNYEKTSHSYYDPKKVIEVTNEPIVRIETFLQKEDPETKKYIDISIKEKSTLYKWNDYLETRGNQTQLEAFWQLSAMKYDIGYNNSNQGTDKQDRIIRQKAKRLGKFTLDYKQECNLLEKNRLYIDRGYRFSSGWLFRPIKPQEIDNLFKLLNELGANVNFINDLEMRDRFLNELKQSARGTIDKIERNELGF